MPYPNEHSCRIANPNLFTTFRRKNNEESEDGREIDVIYGIKSGKTRIQALRYKTEFWSEMDAAEHCMRRGGHFEAASSLSARGVINPLLMA